MIVRAITRRRRIVVAWPFILVTPRAIDLAIDWVPTAVITHEFAVAISGTRAGREGGETGEEE